MRNQTMYCWPVEWLEAAQKAGLATHKGNGEWLFLNDGMRECLAVFATAIAERVESDEREACAIAAEEAAAETSSLWEPGCWAHASAYCAQKIRARGEK